LNAQKKLEVLEGIVKNTGGMAIAFSGGVDSSFLAAVAQRVLGGRALAVTALSPTYSAREQEEAARVARKIGIRHETVVSNELEIPCFADNPPDRCYHCKKELFDVVRGVAAKHGIAAIAHGANADDRSDYRPGQLAAEQGGALSPLMDVGLGKEEIRALSREMGLPTADKPAMACLASRFPYGSRITREALEAVDKVEEALKKCGFRQVRVRHHGDIARIEVPAEEIAECLDETLREKIVRAAREAGFLYVTLDLQGYRTGSMNEPLNRRTSA